MGKNEGKAGSGKRKRGGGGGTIEEKVWGRSLEEKKDK